MKTLTIDLVNAPSDSCDVSMSMRVSNISYMDFLSASNVAVDASMRLNAIPCDLAASMIQDHCQQTGNTTWTCTLDDQYDIPMRGSIKIQ